MEVFDQGAPDTCKFERLMGDLRGAYADDRLSRYLKLRDD